jgi:antitoxin component of MazEF toxin-antitoxin module
MYPYSKEVMNMLAKKTYKNQLTLPKDIVKEFPDTEYFDVRVKGRSIVLTPVRISPEMDLLEEVRVKMKRLGIEEKDVDEAVKWARRQGR